MMKEVMIGMNDGVKVGDKTVKTIRFSDDQAMIEFSEIGLRRLKERTNIVIKNCGMRITVTSKRRRRL